MEDAFGEAPRPVVLVFALTELRLLAGHFGIESIIKHEPDIVLKVCNAANAQLGMQGAPGTLRVVDEQTVYFRPPRNYLEPEILLVALRNLMRNAYDRMKGVSMATVADGAPQAIKQAVVAALAAVPEAAAGPATPRMPLKPAGGKKAALTPHQAAQLEKLQSLKEHGVLTEEEFAAARQRLLKG
jgi:hypothetical protein